MDVCKRLHFSQKGDDTERKSREVGSSIIALLILRASPFPLRLILASQLPRAKQATDPHVSHRVVFKDA